MAEFPQPPPPRSDAPRPESISESDWAAYLEMLSEAGPPPSWFGTDGTLYMRYMPAEMAPKVGGPADSWVSIAPDSPVYAKYARTVPSVYDYRGVEVPSAADSDGDGSGG
jgi:hypothetical protein